MFYSLYDKNFNALGVRKTYPCSIWRINRKALEFDECYIEGMAIENSDGAVFVGLHKADGTLKYLALAGIPETHEGKTIINPIDLRQLLNNDAVINLQSSNVTDLITLYSEVLTCIFSQYTQLGITVTTPDLTEISNGSTALIESTIERSQNVGNPWRIIQTINSIYDCYVDFNWDLLGNILVNKTIQFKVKRISSLINIKLEDFGLPKVKRDYTGINRVYCFQTGNFSNKIIYYLLNNDTVQTEETILNNLSIYSSLIIYPPIIKAFEDSTLDKAKVKGLEELYKNRFKANVEIDLDNKMGYILKDVNFNFFADIYGYKRLPVKEVYEDYTNKKKITFGRLEEFWWLT